MSRRSIHEQYHYTTKKQSRIISRNNFTYRLLIEVTTKYIRPNHEILDIGCGAGTLSFFIASLGNKIFGIDISSKAIRECLNSKNTLGLKKVNFAQMDFPNETPKNKFDAVLLTEVIEHLNDDKKAVASISKLLKKAGIMILSTPSRKAPLHRLGLTRKFDLKVGHLRRYNLDELKRLLTSTGFEIIKVEKAEGIIRNFLFINPYAGKLIRYINFFGSDFVTFLDNISLRLFGESNFIIVARKK